MKKIMFLIIVIIFITGCVEKEWEEFRDEDGKFSVMLPGNPEKTTTQINTEIGVIDLNMFMYEDYNAVYMVAYSDFPLGHIESKGVQQLLDDARDGAVRDINGELINEKITEINGYPGRSLLIKAEEEELMARDNLYIVENRMYQIVIVYPLDKNVDFEMDKFISSFKIF